MTTNNLTTDVFEPLAAAVAVFEEHAAPVDAVSRAGPGPLSVRFFGSISERLQAELQALTMLRERWESHLHSAEAETASRAKEAQELQQSLQGAEADARSKAEAAEAERRLLEAERINLAGATAALRRAELRLDTEIDEKHAALYASLQSQVEEARQGRLAVSAELEEKHKQINQLHKQLEDMRRQLKSANEDESSSAQDVPARADRVDSVMEDDELFTGAATLPTESHGSPNPLPPGPASLAASAVVVHHYDEIIGWFNTPGKWDQRKYNNFKSAFRQKFADLSRDQLVTNIDSMVTGAPANGYGKRVCFLQPTATKKRTNLPKGKDLDRAECPFHASTDRDDLCVQVQFVDGLNKHSVHPQAGSHRWVVKDRT